MAGLQEPEVTHKENPKEPKSPSKPASPRQDSVGGPVAMETQVPLSASQKTRKERGVFVRLQGLKILT